jgi:hypothetical protein
MNGDEERDDGRGRGRNQNRGGGGRGRGDYDQRGGAAGRGRVDGRSGRGYGRNNQASSSEYVPQPHYRPENGNADNPTSGGVDSQVLNFCKSLGDTPFLLTRQNTELWEASFELSTHFPSISFYIPKLLKAYLRFPDQGGYAPNPETVLSVLCFYLPKAKNLADIELVYDIVRERLQRSSSMSKITEKQSILTLVRQLSILVENATKKIFTLPGNDFQKTVQISQGFLTTLGLYDSNVGTFVLSSIGADGETSDEHLNRDPVLQWSSSPTIEWLTNGALYEKIALKRCYSDGQEYVDTVRKVWAMLTFYWGTAAFWPKCGCQSHGGGGGGGGASDARACATPLLTHIGGAGNIYCTKRMSNQEGKCGRPAVWRCMRRDHDAICQRCLVHRQRSLMGSSGINASTDIYDGTIQSIQLNGDAHFINLRNVLSRKPPKENVNWKTSYRLQPSMLVGVIHLHGRNLELRSSMKIHWGEIIIQDKKGGPQLESQRRKDQYMSIRLLSRSDCPDLATSHDMKFSKDSHVAVVDMRVFVPEVMTVLSTLGQRSFLDGFTRVSFSKYLLSPDYEDACPNLPSELASVSLYEHLSMAFQLTTIDCISTLSEDRKQKILQKICNLQVVKTLDRTQREAFVHALLRPLHCTQGPPGTGKVRSRLLSFTSSFNYHRVMLVFVLSSL